MRMHECVYHYACMLVSCVPSTARSFRDGTPIRCPLLRT